MGLWHLPPEGEFLRLDSFRTCLERGGRRILWQQGVLNPERLLRPGDQAVVSHPDTCLMRHDGSEP